MSELVSTLGLLPRTRTRESAAFPNVPLPLACSITDRTVGRGPPRVASGAVEAKAGSADSLLIAVEDFSCLRRLNPSATASAGFVPEPEPGV